MEEWQWRRGQAQFEISLLNPQDLLTGQTGGGGCEGGTGRTRRICHECLPGFWLI